LPLDRLIVCDATKLTDYEDNFFDYSYSIGSLEHFTEEGIGKLINEAHRVTRKATFHMMPTSRSLKNEGWMKTWQSFYNNSSAWWVEKFEKRFPEVLVFDSAWNNTLSVGKWFVCVKS
jgi:ubiquinone/menaquinone biosynthesis C-methylase UbiE